MGDSTNELQISEEEYSLKLREPEASIGNPWGDDKLAAEKVANALTDVVENEPDSLVISLSGEWGSGKTFLLKRWQQSLKNKGFKSIYFNAWEDDFHDDPLIAIIGQLEEVLGPKQWQNIMRIAGYFTQQNALSLFHKFTGIKINPKKFRNKTIEKYKNKRNSKKLLKETLEKVSSEIKGKTKYPLVFIIDELDRCRPTFAIELLERVKHIFDIPHIVFVFGINRKKLCSSIESIYGTIDPTVYLRRFFDMEFLLPSSDIKSFATHLMGKYKLLEFPEISDLNRRELDDFSQYFSSYCGYFDLSLRDIDYCIRSLIFILRSVKEHHSIHPILIIAILIFRMKNPKLYESFIKGDCLSSKVINDMNKYIPDEELYNDTLGFLDILEANLYALTNRRIDTNEICNVPYTELCRLAKKEAVHSPEFLSKRVQKLGAEKAKQIQNYMRRNESSASSRRHLYIPIESLANLLELTSSVIQR